MELDRGLAASEGIKSRRRKQMEDKPKEQPEKEQKKHRQMYTNLYKRKTRKEPGNCPPVVTDSGT